MGFVENHLRTVISIISLGIIFVSALAGAFYFLILQSKLGYDVCNNTFVAEFIKNNAGSSTWLFDILLHFLILLSLGFIIYKITKSIFSEIISKNDPKNKNQINAKKTAIAIAIFAVILSLVLVVLTSVGLTMCPTSFDVKSVMVQGLREINTKGYGATEPRNIQLTRGTVIYRKELIGNLPSITFDQIYFYCQEATGGNGFCGPNNYIKTDNTALTAVKAVSAYAVICGDEQGGVNKTGKYCIGVAKTPQDATKACTQASACNLQ